MYWSVVTSWRQRSSSLSATLRAPRLVAWLVMASRVTLAPALLAYNMGMLVMSSYK